MFSRPEYRGKREGEYCSISAVKRTILDTPGLLEKVIDVNMMSFQHVPVCGFFELYNLFDTVTFQTVYICRLTDNQI